MNRLLKLLLPGFFVCSVASAQIPTTDVASIATDLTNHIATIQQWKSQYDQMTAQIDGLKAQYNSVTGNRGLGNILNDPSFRDYLPSDWATVYDAVNAGGYKGLTGPAKKIFDTNQIFDTCANIKAGQEKAVCEAQAVKGAQDKAFALAAYDSAQKRIDQINGLMNAIAGTQDPKAIAELQARIGTEQALIQNEQTKLALFQVVSQAQAAIHQRQKMEIERQKMARRDFYLDLKPTNLLSQ